MMSRAPRRVLLLIALPLLGCSALEPQPFPRPLQPAEESAMLSAMHGIGADVNKRLVQQKLQAGTVAVRTLDNWTQPPQPLPLQKLTHYLLSGLSGGPLQVKALPEQADDTLREFADLLKKMRQGGLKEADRQRVLEMSKALKTDYILYTYIANCDFSSETWNAQVIAEVVDTNDVKLCCSVILPVSWHGPPAPWYQPVSSPLALTAVGLLGLLLAVRFLRRGTTSKPSPSRTLCILDQDRLLREKWAQMLDQGKAKLSRVQAEMHGRSEVAAVQPLEQARQEMEVLYQKIHGATYSHERILTHPEPPTVMQAIEGFSNNVGAYVGNVLAQVDAVWKRVLASDLNGLATMAVDLRSMIDEAANRFQERDNYLRGTL